MFKHFVTGDKVLPYFIILVKKLLCLCPIGFCDQASSWSSSLAWTEELCSQQPFLVGDWSRVLGSTHWLVTYLGAMHQKGKLLLGTYFYVIGISFDKTHFTCIWANLSRFKMIITSGYIENMKITQELLKKSAIYKSRYLLNKSSICRDSLKLDTCLDLSSLRDSDYS